MVLPILARGALAIGKQIVKKIGKKKGKKLTDKQKEMQVDKAMRDKNHPLRKAFEKLAEKKEKGIKFSKGGLAGRLAKRGYGKAMR